MAMLLQLGALLTSQFFISAAAADTVTVHFRTTMGPTVFTVARPAVDGRTSIVPQFDGSSYLNFSTDGLKSLAASAGSITVKETDKENPKTATCVFETAGPITGEPECDVSFSVITLHCRCINFPRAPGVGRHATGKTFVNDPDHIDRLNSIEGSTWTAAANDFFEGLSFDGARIVLGTDLLHISDHLDHVLDERVYAAMGNNSIPASFDATIQWAGLIHPIRNQQRCGSCWAFSASEVLSDRVAIATKKASPVLSPEDMVSCDKGDMGCSGGQLPNAWKYLQSTGIVSDTCFPYAAGGGSAPACPSKCVDSETWSQSKVKASSAYAINGVTNMQKEIMTNGPIQVAFKVYKSFMSYKSGIYQKHFWELLPEGGHAVKIVGWGVDNGVDYWKVANSWATSWGEDGFFRILRGKDQCGMETMGPPYAGMPAVSNEGPLVV